MPGHPSSVRRCHHSVNIVSCGKQFYRQFCLSVCLSVRLSKDHQPFEMKVTLVIRSFCNVLSVAPSLFVWLTSYVAYLQCMRGGCVTYHFQNKNIKDQSQMGRSKFLQCPLYSSILISPIHIIWNTHTTHEVTMCHIPFRGPKIKGQGHSGHLKFLWCPLRGFLLIWLNHFLFGIHDGAMCYAPFSRSHGLGCFSCLW